MKVLFPMLLAVFPVLAQQRPPDDGPPPIGPVEEVPLPTEEDLLDASDLDPATPESVRLDFAAGFDFARETQTLTSRGAIRAVADTGMSLRADGGRYEGNAKRLVAEGAVKLETETGVEIFADRAVLDDAARTVTLTGDVSIYRGQFLQRGDRVVYQIDTGKLDSSGLRTGVDPLLLEADGFTVEERDGRQVFVGRNAGVTTHDVREPAFWVRADETTVYPGDRVTFRNMTLRVNDVPLFWLPYFAQPLDGKLGYHFVPGGRSNWGPYLLNSYGIMLGDDEDAWLLSRWNFDLRAKRGLAAGIDLIDRRLEDNENLTGLSLYYANDLDPTLSRSGLPRPFVNEDRWRARLRQRAELPFEGGDRWRLEANLTALSDNYFLEDFAPDEFTVNPAPDNTLGLFRRDDHSLFGLAARFDINPFYRSETRLPEISFDQSRRPLFGTPILHEGRSSFAVIREEIGSSNRAIARTILNLPAGSRRVPGLLNRLPPYERRLVRQLRALPPGSPQIPSRTTQLLDPGYTRFHSYQSLSLPTKIGGWLNLTPEIGAGYSHYGSVNGPAKSLSRNHFYAGAEASVKFSRDYGDLVDRSLGLDGLLHVVRPYARLSHLDTDELNPLFPTVDRENFTTRPRTLDPNRFNAIDSLRDWSIFRVGVRNSLITRRDGQSYEWLSLNSYIDRFWEDPELDRTLSNLYNDLTWEPLPWLGLDLETQFPIVSDGSDFSEVNARLRFMPTENIELSVANRFLDNHPILVDSNRINFRGYARLSDDWGVGTSHVWELDDGTLEIQQYNLHRDFDYLTGALGFSIRDNRLKTEYGLVLSLTLKDFPSASVPLGLDAP